MYYATKKHSSISRTELHELKAVTLLGAKREATRIYQNDYLDHEIIILDSNHSPVACRKISDRRWVNIERW